jgi:hypothetical protein
LIINLLELGIKEKMNVSRGAIWETRCLVGTWEYTLGAGHPLGTWTANEGSKVLAPVTPVIFL